MATTTKKKTTPKTTAKRATTSNTTKRTSSSNGKVATHERDAKVVAVDSLYAVAGISTDAIRFTRTLPERVNGLRTGDLEKRVKELRDRAEQRFDAKSAEGRTVIDDILKQRQVKQVLDQAKTARSQVKAAFTSIRKTATNAVDAGLTAGRKQASTAKSQTKAAVTSVQKTANAAVDAAAQTISNN